MDLEGIKLNEVSPMDKFHIIILIFSIKNFKKKGKTNTENKQWLPKGVGKRTKWVKRINSMVMDEYKIFLVSMLVVWASLVA